MSVSTDKPGVPAPVPVLAIHKRDGRVVARFESINKAARWALTSARTVHLACSNLSLPRGPYMFRREDNWSGRETFKAGAPNRPVAVMSKNELLWFPSVRVAADALGASMSHVEGALHKGFKVFGKYQVAYLTSTDDWPRLKALVEQRRDGCELLK